jgi:hypothetical protein
MVSRPNCILLIHNEIMNKGIELYYDNLLKIDNTSPPFPSF